MDGWIDFGLVSYKFFLCVLGWSPIDRQFLYHKQYYILCCASVNSLSVNGFIKPADRERNLLH